MDRVTKLESKILAYKCKLRAWKDRDKRSETFQKLDQLGYSNVK